MKILVIGATGGTGKEIVRHAIAKTHDVIALVRDASKSGIGLEGVQFVQGDIRDMTAVQEAMSGCDGVVSALGTGMSPFHKVTLLSEGTAALIAAMNASGVRRLVCITGIGAGDSRGHGGRIYDTFVLPLLLRNVYADKERQEELIRKSGLDWIIVRPAMLNDKPPRRAYRALTDLSGYHGGEVSRADVASFVVEQLETLAYVRETPLVTW